MVVLALLVPMLLVGMMFALDAFEELLFPTPSTPTDTASVHGTPHREE
ncbi:hypothetical protein [Streptomyces sp. NPDC007355]